MGCSTSRPLRLSTRNRRRSRQEALLRRDQPFRNEEEVLSREIDRKLGQLRQRDELKVKLLLLGPEGSGKRTLLEKMSVFQNIELTEDDRRKYGVIIRSNIIVTMGKLCTHLRKLGLEDQLAEESTSDATDLECYMSPKEAYQLIVDRIVENRVSGNTDERSLKTINSQVSASRVKDVKEMLQRIDTVIQVHTMQSPWSSPGLPFSNPNKGYGRPYSSFQPFSPVQQTNVLLNQVNALHDLLLAHLEGYIANVPEHFETSRLENGQREDWVGRYPQAGTVANRNAALLLELWKPIYILWNSETMKQVWAEHQLLGLHAGCKYCLQDLKRIASPFFYPSQQDVHLARHFHARECPHHQLTNCFRCDGIEVEVYNVLKGQQKSTHRQWIHSFDAVDAVIFVADLSRYDEVDSSNGKNHLSQTLEDFRSVCNNEALADKSILLILNKKKELAKKILHSDIGDQPSFQDYTGPPNDFKCGLRYFIRKFKACIIARGRSESFIHVSGKDDDMNLSQFILDSTRAIIMMENLRRSGFLGGG